MKTRFSLLTLWMLAGAMIAVAGAADLREATFTQVVNSVSVSDPQGARTRAAQLNGKFATPEVIRTGADSRAELTAADQTVTRVGANTIFSFKPEGRGVNLQQGSVLFNSPTGRGGGTIQTAAATASVLGTTIIVSTTSNGGFKLLVLEGKAKATLPNGRNFVIGPGQMSFITPGMTRAPQVFEFRLGKQNEGSKLLKSFSAPLPAQEKIDKAIDTQEKEIASGEKADTGLMIGKVVGDEIQLIDPNLLQTALRTLSGDEFGDLIKKLKQAVTVNKTISTSTIDPSQMILFPSSFSLALGLVAIDAKVGNLYNVPDKTLIFAANELTISTYTLDLSPFTGQADTIAFFGKTSLNMGSSLSITGFGGEVVFHSDGFLQAASSLSYNGTSLQVEANMSSWSLLGYNFSNTGGELGITNYSGDMVFNYGTYTAGTDIMIEAGGNLSILTGSYLPGNSLSLYAGGNMTLTSLTYGGYGRSLYAISGGLMTLSAGNYTPDNAFFYGGSGLSLISGATINVSDSVTLASGGAVNINASNITASENVVGYGATFTATSSSFSSSSGSVILSSNNGTTLDGSNVVAKDIAISAVVGTVNLNNGAFSANTSLAVTGTSVAVANSSFSGYTAGNGSATFTAGHSAGNTLAFNNVNFNMPNYFSSVTMQAHTINLTGVQFNSTTQYYFRSLFGDWNFGSSSPGYINFIGGNTVNGNPINGTGDLTSNFHKSTY